MPILKSNDIKQMQYLEHLPQTTDVLNDNKIINVHVSSLHVLANTSNVVCMQCCSGSVLGLLPPVHPTFYPQEHQQMQVIFTMSALIPAVTNENLH
jgi:hypothetical protein